MGIYIKDMEMPSDGIGQRGYKDFRVWHDGTVEVLHGYHVKETSYKAVPVPPHGRLIDADKLDFGMVFVGASDFARDCRDGAQSVVDSASTIIPAEEEK